MIDWQHQTKFLLAKAGLLPVFRRARRTALALVSTSFRREQSTIRREAREYKRRYGASLGQRLGAGGHKRAVILNVPTMAGVAVDSFMAKSLEKAGFRSTIITSPDSWVNQYLSQVEGVKLKVWDDFVNPGDMGRAQAMMAPVESSDQLLAIEYEGARIGRFAASSVLRKLRVGSLDFQSAKVRKSLVRHLNKGISYTRTARSILERERPDLAVFVDRGYSPAGELFDICLEEKVDTITWNTAHKSNTVMLKRYNKENRDEHPSSLSDETWQWLRKRPWTHADGQLVHDELHDAYASGDWYSDVGTQFGKVMFESGDLRRRLGLDPNKKTAVIFAHILWDGTFFWGADLFANYEDWLVETVRAACLNDRLNWVIKVHPANVAKDARDGYRGQPSEVIAIERAIGSLPAHVKLLSAESDINTYSIFPVMDYCVTVRGTIGMESAALGIPVITAGTGRYDHKGFTIDSESEAEYLKRLASLEELAPPTPQALELAEKFAYGVFVLRPMLLNSVTVAMQQDEWGTGKIQINTECTEDWLAAADVNSLAQWAADGVKEDYLWDQWNLD